MFRPSIRARTAEMLVLALMPVLAFLQTTAGAKAATDGPKTPVGQLEAIKPVKSCSDLANVDLGAIGGEGSRITKVEETSADGVGACSVQGILAPSIGFEVRLPTETWT